MSGLVNELEVLPIIILNKSGHNYDNSTKSSRN